MSKQERTPEEIIDRLQEAVVLQSKGENRRGGRSTGNERDDA